MSLAALNKIMDRARDDATDRGATLIELLVTVMIVGIAVVALLSGVTTAIIVSDQHRQQAVAGAAVHSFAEAVTATAYVNCAGKSKFANPVGYVSPAGYTSTVTGVKYWDPDTRTFSTSCPSYDAGIQKVSLKVVSNAGRATATLDVVARKAAA
jgi:type II secretory pathway pseudopilin PulG